MTTHLVSMFSQKGERVSLHNPKQNPKGTFALLIARSFYLSPALSATDWEIKSSLNTTRVRHRKSMFRNSSSKKGGSTGAPNTIELAEVHSQPNLHCGEVRGGSPRLVSWTGLRCKMKAFSLGPVLLRSSRNLVPIIYPDPCAHTFKQVYIYISIDWHFIN